MLDGEVEADETFMSGLARNMYNDVKARKVTGTGGKDKTDNAMVFGILKRGGEVRTKVVSSRKKKALQSEVHQHVEAGSAIFTDALKSHEGLTEFEHQVVDHAAEYAPGKVHTNGMENFWSLVKRGLKGTYISIEPFHLFRYLDERAWRYNSRKDEVGEPVRDFRSLQTGDVSNRRKASDLGRSDRQTGGPLRAACINSEGSKTVEAREEVTRIATSPRILPRSSQLMRAASCGVRNGPLSG